MAQIVGGIHQKCAPDVWCLQEDNLSKSLCDEVLSQYHTFSPALIDNASQAVHLLIRKDGRLLPNTNLTTEALQTLASQDFVQALQTRLQDVHDDAQIPSLLDAPS